MSWVIKLKIVIVTSTVSVAELQWITIASSNKSRAINHICNKHRVGSSSSYSIRLYSRLCPSTAGSCPPPESIFSLFFPALFKTDSSCPTAPYLWRHVGPPSDLTSFTCHFLLPVVLLSFDWATCPAHFHFTLVLYWTISVTLVLCQMMVL